MRSNSQLADLVNAVDHHKKLRVWSLIITFFGDAVMARGGVVSAQTIQAVFEKLSVNDNAIRTALSRLAADGWIVTERRGRNAFYQLAPSGYEPFQKASAKIYASTATHSSTSEKLYVALLPPDKEVQALWLNHPQSTLVTPRCVLFTGPLDELKMLSDQTNALILDQTVGDIPDWLSQILLPTDLAADMRSLMSNFANLTGLDDLPPIDALSQRLLLIHEWRRICLRIPDIPTALFPANWKEAECRTLVGTLYRQLFETSERWLDDNIGPLKPPADNDDLHAAGLSTHLYVTRFY